MLRLYITYYLNNIDKKNQFAHNLNVAKKL